VITISAVDIASEDARTLIAQLDAYLNLLYAPEDNFLELPHGHVRDGNGVFLVAYVDGEPTGCGAIRRLSLTTGEVKRMYVAPAGRKKGVGSRLLADLESWALQAGLSRLVLETGTLQQDAIRLYRKAGFEPIERFGEYTGAPESYCYGKELTPNGPAN